MNEITLTVDPQGGHRKYLNGIALKIVETLIQKDKEYGASWKQRGGVGAYMMLARKWDRIENGLKPLEQDLGSCRLGSATGLLLPPYDIITAVLVDSRKEGIEDDVKDLIGYLLLVLAEAEYQNKEVIGVVAE